MHNVLNHKFVCKNTLPFTDTRFKNVNDEPIESDGPLVNLFNKGGSVCEV